MSLTRKQLKTLNNIRSFKENPPDSIFVLKKNLAYGLKVSVPLGLAIYLMSLQNWMMPVAFVAGIICGIWYIIFIHVLSAKRLRFWVFMVRVIDWQKCDELQGQKPVQSE